ncbi:MAG: hypothetical protein KC501_05065, partial [Myxococcales bacterium]|nr:hypothetical protein [Myxococcales bacterium]
MTQAEQLAAQAAQWQAAGRPDMAVQLYTAALDQDPSKFAIRMQLAECLAYLQQPEPAAEHYLMVAQAYAARGHPQECLAICERVINIAPQSFVYMSVGPMIRRIGRQARPLCAKAAELHLGAGRQTDGLQMLRLGAELDPHNPEVRMQLARIYQARHMKREAVEALSDAGNLLLQAKRYQDYVGVASQVLALEPRDLNTLRDMPRVYLELGRPHDAVRALGQLTKASPGDIVGYEILAQAFAVIGRSDKSLAVLERLVEELGATGQADKADAILNHARYWRPTDLGFLRSLKRVEIPRPRTIPPVDPPPPAPEGTVVLSIADLVMEESRRAPVPGREDSSVRLIEAEGTLTLDLDELLVDEMEQVMLRSSTPSRPPPPPPKSRPGPKLDVNATITLDGAALMEALVELEGGKDDDDGHDEDATTVPPGTPAAEEPEATRALSPLDPSLLPKPSPPASSRAITRPEMPAVADGPPPPAKAAISELIYDDDDDDDDGEPATMLHMRALTPEEIARAQQAVAQAAAERAQARAEAEDTVDQDATTIAPPGAAALPRVDLDAPTIAPPGAAALPRVDLDAPTIAPPVAAPPSRARPPLIDDLEGPTLGPAHGSMDDIDAPTLGPMGPDTTFGGGEEAPTMARLTPLSAADIARALAKGQPRATAPVPEPPSPPMPVAPPQWSAPPPPAS